jgi:hypothetical protein
MTQKERLEQDIKELQQKCKAARNEIIADGVRNWNADKWLDVWYRKGELMIHDIRLLSVEPKREYIEPCLRFIIEFEDGQTEFINVNLPETVEEKA